MVELETLHRVAGSPADAISQWFNAGGMLQFYDYELEIYLNVKKRIRLRNATIRAPLTTCLDNKGPSSEPVGSA